MDSDYDVAIDTQTPSSDNIKKTFYVQPYTQTTSIDASLPLN